MKPGPTGMHPVPDFMVRLSRLPIVTIASVRGRATGIGSELVLATDMRFVSREQAILSQWEVGAGLVAGGRPAKSLAAPGRPRSGPRDPDRVGRHRRRSGRALWLCQSVSAGCRARRLRGGTGRPHRLVRKTGHRRHRETRRCGQPASRRGNATDLGRIHRLGGPSGHASASEGLDRQGAANARGGRAEPWPRDCRLREVIGAPRGRRRS